MSEETEVVRERFDETFEVKVSYLATERIELRGEIFDKIKNEIGYKNNGEATNISVESLEENEINAIKKLRTRTKGEK